MFDAEFLQELGSGAGTSGLHVLIPPANTFHCFLIVLALPLEIICHHFIESGGCVLPVASRVIFQLGLAFRLEGYGVHACECRGAEAGCQRVPSRSPPGLAYTP